MERQPPQETDRIAGEPETDRAEVPGPRWSRRGLMGAAAVGAGVAASMVVGARPAGASPQVRESPDQPPVYVQLGVTNPNTADATEVTATADNGIVGTTTATTSGLAGVFGMDSSVGEDDSGGYGLYGSSDLGIGVYGTTGPDVSGLLGGDPNGVHIPAIAGVIGDSYDDAGVVGLSIEAPGVYGASFVNGGPAILGADVSNNGGYGVTGESAFGVGVEGKGATTGVVGTGATAGVSGSSSAGKGVSGSTAIGTAVSGTVTGSVGAGVVGTSNAAKGVGVVAASTDGIALKVEGRLALSHSGVASVAKGGRSAAVHFTGLSSSSLIIATIQGSAGDVAVANVVPAANACTINLTGPAPVALRVAWFAIN